MHINHHLMNDKEFSSSISICNFFVKIVILLGLFFVARILLLCCNYNFLRAASTYALAQAFLVGVRVDLVTVFTLNLPIFVFWFLPVQLKTKSICERSANTLFFIVNFIALLVNIVDARYFSFSYRRMNGDIFNETVLLTENPEVYIEMVKQFWYVPLTGVFVLVALWMISFRLPVARKVERIALREYAYFVVTVGLCVICVRGGFQRKPFNPSDTLAYTGEPLTAYLANNTALNIFHTRRREVLPQLKFFPENDKAFEIYSPKHYLNPDLIGKFRGKNVFIIIMESFSGEYVGAIDQRYKKEGTRSFTPFLDSLIKKSYTFDAFANGKVSVSGLTAIAGGTPSLFDSTFVVSRYAENSITAFPELLGKKGYNAVFFYGGHKNSCHFDGVRVKAGIKSYYCCDDYDGPSEDIRAWGVYDDRFLQFAAKKIDAMEEPFVSVLFTLSSHHPYCYPKEFDGQFPKDEIPLPEFIAYADFSLKKFFETAEKMDWYKDTIFVLVADHTAGQQQEYYTHDLGIYSIPLIIFDPNGSLIGQSDTVVQQIDIMPTILDLLGYDEPYFAFGSDMFDENAPHFAVSFNNGIYQIITHDYVLQMDREKVVGFYSRADYLLEHNLIQLPEYKEDMTKVETLFKSFLQQYVSAIRDNKLKY